MRVTSSCGPVRAAIPARCVKLAVQEFEFTISLFTGSTTHAGIPEILPKSGPATDQHATPEQMEAIKKKLSSELDAGALAVGMGIQYSPGATRQERTAWQKIARASND